MFYGAFFGRIIWLDLRFTLQIIILHRGETMFVIVFVFCVIILALIVVAVVTGNVAYFVNQQSLGKDADEEE